MPKEQLHTSSSGFSLIEVILAAALFSMLVTGLVGAYLYGQEATAQAGNRARGQMVAEEGLEALRNMRDADYSNLVDGTFGLALESNHWILSGSSDLSGIFTRQIEISTLSDNEKAVMVTVTWQQNPQREGQVQLESRLTNWLAVSSYSWANPYQAASISLRDNRGGEKIAVLGRYAFVIRNNSDDDDASFFIIDISDPARAAVVGWLRLEGLPTNLAVEGHYAYISSRDDKRELQIIDVENFNEPRMVGTYDLDGNFDATGIAVTEQTVYLTRMSGASDELSIFDARHPDKPEMLGRYPLETNAYDVEVSGRYVYIAAAGDTGRELQIIDVSSYESPQFVASLDLPGEAIAPAVALAGTTLFISQGSIVYSVDVTKPETPAILGSNDIGNNIYDIARRLAHDNAYLFLATGGKTAQFKVIDVSNLARLALFGSADMAGAFNLYGAAYDQVTDRVFAVGDRDENGKEFFIFSPQ